MDLLLRCLIACGLSGMICLLTGCRMSDQKQAQRSINAHQKQSLSQQAKQAGNLPEARELLEDAIRINPHDAGNHYQLADILARERNNAAAVCELMRCAELVPDDPRTYTRLARIMLDEGSEEKALELVESALQLDPYRVQALVVHARIMQRRERYDKAIADYLLALAQRPYPAEVAVELSTLYQQLGRHQDAIVLLQHGLRESQGQLEMTEVLTWQIGLAHAQTESWGLSAHYLQEALAQQSHPASSQLLTLAQVQLNASDLTSAVATLERHVKLYPTHLQAHTMLADIRSGDSSVTSVPLEQPALTTPVQTVSAEDVPLRATVPQ